MVYGIIKQHDGLIHVYSEPSQGTTFKIYLPAIDRHAQPATAKSTVKAAGGTETILLAEDDIMVRNVAIRVLEMNGYHVLPAVDGEEAVRVFKNSSDKISLAVLDVVMPKMGGRDAYTHIKSIQPGIRTLFTSGYSADSLRSEFLVDEELLLIQKPYSPNDLLIRVRELLDRSPQKL